MVILDTDHVTLLQRRGPESYRIETRLNELPLNEVATTVVSYEEQTRGWLAHISRARDSSSHVEAYRLLKRHLLDFCALTVVEFDDLAEKEFQRLNNLRLRLGTLDLRIAAIALSHKATLLTRNSSDFGRIPGLKVEDWSV